MGPALLQNLAPDVSPQASFSGCISLQFRCIVAAPGSAAPCHRRLRRCSRPASPRIPGPGHPRRRSSQRERGPAWPAQHPGNASFVVATRGSPTPGSRGWVEPSIVFHNMSISFLIQTQAGRAGHVCARECQVRVHGAYDSRWQRRSVICTDFQTHAANCQIVQVFRNRDTLDAVAGIERGQFKK